MNENPIKSEFFLFEKLFFEVESFDNNNFFVLLDYKEIEKLFYSFLITNPLKDNDLDKLFKKDIKSLVDLLQTKNINFTNFIYFKSEYDVLSAYLLLFLIKVFAIKSKKRGEDDDSSFPSSQDFSFSSSRDFLFDRDDYMNAFSDFLFKFFVFNEIKSKTQFSFSKERLRKFIYRFVDLCVKKGLIASQDVRILKYNYKTLKFTLFSIPYAPHVVFYTNKFNFYVRSNIEFYAYNLHFSSIVEITKKAKYSNSHFKISTERLDALSERSVYIDRSLLKKNFDYLLKDEKLDENTNLHDITENLYKKIEKFTIEDDLASLRYFHSKMSKILTLIRIKTILSMNFDNHRLYLPFKFCFRGRIYELSDLSFTFYKEFRFCMYSGIYENETESFHPISAQISITLEKQFILFEDFKWFTRLSKIRKFACVWIFISIGALKKTELGLEVHISVFVLKGLEMWKKSSCANFEDVYERIEFNYLLNLINELIYVEKNLKKWLFWKDAPASCFQHQLLILGARGDDSYKICNLDSIDTWYDPYSFLIKHFFEKNCDKFTKNLYTKTGLMLTKLKFFEIFSRKRLKKVFMTESYGAGYKKLTAFFVLDLNLTNYSKEEECAIMMIWENFFNYTSNENPLFAQNSKEITKYFVDNDLKIIINPDQTEVDYSCFKIEITQIELYIESKRRTLQNRSITSMLDNTQFKTSIRANFVHTQDAVLARKYVSITKMWSIHDCFSIDFLNITHMVALLNELMNGEFFDLKISKGDKKYIYSIFIIL